MTFGVLGKILGVSYVFVQFLERIGDFIEALKKPEYLPRLENFEFTLKICIGLKNQMHDIVQILLERKNVLTLNVLDN